MQQQLQDVFDRYTGEQSELIPILQDIQDVFGYIPSEAMSETARFLNLPASTVYGVTTFYAQFHLSPQGRNRIHVCQGTACHVRGAEKIITAIQAHLGIAPGETSQDFEFSLEGVACFGSCALAPVLVVNDTVYGKVTPAQAVDILEALR